MFDHGLTNRNKTSLFLLQVRKRTNKYTGRGVMSQCRDGVTKHCNDIHRLVFYSTTTLTTKQQQQKQQRQQQQHCRFREVRISLLALHSPPLTHRMWNYTITSSFLGNSSSIAFVCLFRVDVVLYGVWTSLNQFERVWTGLESQFEPVWTSFNQFDVVWTTCGHLVRRFQPDSPEIHQK